MKKIGGHPLGGADYFLDLKTAGLRAPQMGKTT
jgi:hypothetical protein